MQAKNKPRGLRGVQDAEQDYGIRVELVESSYTLA